MALMVEQCFFAFAHRVHRLTSLRDNKTAKSNHAFTFRAGLMAPAMLLERLGPGKIVDRHGTIFETFMLMFHEGAQCLEDERHLRKERPPVELTGPGSLPCSGF